MDQIAEIITQTWMVYVFVSIIVLVALRPLYLAVFGIKAVNNDLDQAIGILRVVGRDRLQDEFYNRFKDIHSQISKIRGLRHAWREFVDSMYFGSAATSKRVYLSHRPSYYFNRESVLGTRLNLSQFLAYPGYLIGIGLTFTFIGLAAALHVAQAGLASGAGQQALKDLLAVASIKFISSIFGIASSLVVSSLQRIRIMTFQQKLSAFCDLLEDCTEYKSAEKLLHDNFQEQRKHTAALGDMAGNIATGISEAISTQLSASVTHALTPLTQDIKSLAEKFVGSCESALKNVLDEFLGQLRRSSADDLQGLIDNTRALKESLGALTNNMESVGKNFGAAAQDSAARLAGMLDNFGTSFAPVQQGIGQFAQAITAMESVAAKIGKAGDHISGAAGDQQKAAAEFGKAASDMAAGFAPMREVLSGLSQSLGKVQETALELKAAGGTIAAAADGFKQSAASIEQAENRFGQKAQVFESLAQGVSSSVRALENSSGRIGDAAKPLSDVSSAITNALQAMQEMETKVQRNQQELHVLLGHLQGYTETLPNLWKRYEESFSKVDGNLGKAFGDLTRGSEDFRAGIQAFVRVIDDQFSKAIGSLNSAIGALSDAGLVEKKDNGLFTRLKSKWGK